MNEFTFIDDLKDLEQHAYDTGNKIQTQINNPAYDARVSTFYFIAQVVRWVKIYLILKDDYLDDPKWYKNIYLSKHKQQPPEIRQVTIPIDPHKVLIKEFNEVMIVAYSQVLYSIMETKFRLFLMTINQKNPWSFNDVYTKLLGEIKKTEYQDFIEFFSLIRNTIHDNGKYFDANRPYIPKEYKGKKYEFKHNKMVSYKGGTFTLLLKQITPDVIDMMEDIILKSKLIKIQSIPEPVI
jgi:hypothetical protein